MTLPNILWKPLPGYEEDYIVYEDGEVEVIKDKQRKKKGDILKGHISVDGYAMITVSKIGGKTTNKYLHRILAELFIPNPDNLPVVNHKNGDRADFRLTNLEWVSRRENCGHQFLRTGRKGVKYPKYSLGTLTYLQKHKNFQSVKELLEYLKYPENVKIEFDAISS